MSSAPIFSAPAGKLVQPVGGFDLVRSVVIDDNGRIVVAGYTISGDRDFAVMRLNADGSLDTSFGSAGTLILDVGGHDDISESVMIDGDGKILLAGHSRVDGNLDFSVVRLNPDGSFDTDFGTNGKLTQPVGSGTDEGRSVIIDAAGKIVVAGNSETSGGHGFSVMRLNSDGSLDPSFGSGGTFIHRVGGHHSVGLSAVIDNDKILVAGYSNGQFGVIRLNADGSLDSSFGSGGEVLLPVGNEAKSIVTDDAGRIVLAGNTGGSGSDLTVIRLKADGSLDTDFGTDGTVSVNMGDTYAHRVLIDNDGKILVAGDGTGDNGYQNFSVVRLNEDGSLDTSFNGSGKVILPVIDGRSAAYDMAIDDDGTIVLAGESYGGFGVLRLNPDGTLDPYFGASNTLDGLASFTEGDAPVVMGGTVQVFDAEHAQIGHYGGATVTLARQGGAQAEDVFGASHLLVFEADGTVVFDGMAIGAFTQAGGTLTITFNEEATQERVDETLSALTYENTNSHPPASVTIDWTFTDADAGGSQSVTGTSTVNITSVDDTTPPVFQSAETSADGARLILSYNEALDALNLAAAADFTVLVNGNANAATGVKVNGSTVELTLTAAIVHGQTVTVSYTDPSNADDVQAIQDADGNDAATLTDEVVTNTVPDTTPPEFVSATTSANGSKLILTYDEVLDAANTAVAADFIVLVNGNTNAVTNVTVNGDTVVLALTTTIAHDQTITVAYADPTTANDANAIQDISGNDAADLPADTVVTNTVAPEEEDPDDIPTIIPLSTRAQALEAAPAPDADGIPLATPGATGSFDEIQSAYSVRLGDNADGLVLTGDGNVHAWDNAADNVIYGNAGSNIIHLSSGNDVVDGGAGFDRLVLPGTRQDYEFAIREGLAFITHRDTGEINKAANITSVSYGSRVDSQIDGLYKAYYGREASGEEYAAGVARLQAGTSVQDLAAECAATSESQAHLASAASDADFVATLYTSVLGRPPDPDGLFHWAADLESGQSSRARLALNFATSDEYQSYYSDLFATNQSDITGLYRALLGRAPDDAGFAYYLDHSARGETLAQIADVFIHSDEFAVRLAETGPRQMLDELYDILLMRNPDTEGLAYWQNQLEEGMTIADIALSFVTDDEFQLNIDELLYRNDWLDLV